MLETQAHAPIWPGDVP